MRRRRPTIAALAAILAIAAAARGARAQPSRARRCAAEGPWVLVVAPAAGVAGLDVPAFLERLGIELSSRGIELCVDEPAKASSPPLATIRLAAPAPASPGAARPVAVGLDIEVRDAVTAKRVAREVDLAGVPPDGRSVVVALAADELVRASWAELSLPRAPPPALELSPRAREAIALATEPPPRAFGAGLGARAGGEWWTGGLALYGGDATVALRPTPATSIELALGARFAPDVSAPHGTLGASAITARLGGGVRLAHGPVDLSIHLRAGAYLVRLEGVAAPGAPEGEGSSARSVALTLEAGPALAIPLGGRGATLVTDVGLAGAMRGVAGSDDGEAVAGVSGIGVVASLGFVAEVL